VRTKKHWRVLHCGTTIGAKRLLRSELVSADAIRFTFVEYLAVPVISSVGVFRACAAFAKSNGMPFELTNIEAYRLKQTGNWLWDDENILSAAQKASASFAFKGTKAWIVGTTDEEYGDMNVFVDDFLVKMVVCKSPVRRTRQLLFRSEDLADCNHVIHVECVSSAPVAIHNLFLLQNGGWECLKSKH
jgi:hypothetical protein